MAACSFGPSSFKLSNLNFGSGRTKLAALQRSYVTNIQTPLRYDGLVLSKRSGKSFTGCGCLSAKAQSIANLEDGSEEVESSGSVSQLIPNSLEVESLLTGICDTTSIAEFELKLGGFRLYVMRNLTGDSNSSPPSVSAPVISTPVEAQTQAPEPNGSASSASLAISKRVAFSGGDSLLLDRAADEGLVIMNSPRVGLFTRRRIIKKKKMPPSCKENQIVKEGQVVCYIEQLGSQYPVETEVAGEVIKILREDGDPVGYGDPLIAILPSFPGIKKLQ